ncbi:heat shock 70 kDa protein 14-like isoform X2 [Rhododendron vialii]|uniref:heat shock 70 kDa protein 14-like isoform X2 n=1 Tax=Rhododendron vialii TaxID=182163 RepID=UPI00265FE15A|nr:heat shock 70 kDa protein 14-like isoform X2 [Rhododendron vialii]
MFHPRCDGEIFWGDAKRPISTAENLAFVCGQEKLLYPMSVVGFDIGNESCVVAVARQRGIDVVLNDESKGETPSIVCFGEKQRFLGTAGAASSMMNPKNTISQIKRLIGRQFSDPELQQDLKALPFTVTEGPDGFPLIHAWYLGETRMFTPTQLLAMVLSDMKSMAEKNLNAAVVDCCIGIPVYFTELQRRAVLDAATIAGLHPLRLLHETTATALAYGIYKTDLPENGQLNVAFVDIGHASMQVCIAGFKEGQLKILAHSFDRSLGGRDFDEALFQYFAAKFKEKYKIDVYQNARACLRLRTACEKLKRVLSANPEAPLNIECLMEEKDVKGFIKRENFEKISIPILERVRKPLEKALSEARLTVENIHSVEVVGSGSRVPAIIRILTEFFRKEPRRTMNSSECVAKGCALECAILSSTFEVQKIQVNESFPFPIAFSWKGASPDAQNGVSDDQISAIGFPKGDDIPGMKTLTLYRSGTFTVDVQYADVSELQAPAKISSYTIGPFQSTQSERVKVKVKVRLNLHGIVSIESATANKTNIPVVEHIYGGMCPADVQKATEEEFEMAFQDRIMEETQNKKNAVEAYVYEMRNKLRGKYQEFVTDPEREGLTAKLQEVEDWLYEDGENKTKGVYVAKLEELKKQGDPIEERYKKYIENGNFLEGQEGVDTGTVERVAESHAPIVEPSTSQLEVPHRGLPRDWTEGDYLVSRYPDGSAGMRLGAQEEIKLTPRTLFAEVREEHKAILSNIFELWPSTFVRIVGASSIIRKLALDSLVSFVEWLENMSLPQATPGDFDSARDGLQALTHFRLEVGWLRKRLDQMAALLELPVARDQLEKVGKEIEEMEEVVRQLKDKKEGLVQRVSELESASSGGYDMSSHAGQGLRG